MTDPQISTEDPIKNKAAIDISPNGLRMHFQGFVKALAHIPDTFQPESVVDARYGLGRWAELVKARWPKCGYVGYERDERTVAAAVVPEGVEVRQSLFPEPPPDLPCDLLMFDASAMTVNSREFFESALAGLAPTYAFSTDIAMSRIHLNYRGYGLATCDMNEYWAAYSQKVSGYSVVAWSYGTKKASVALWKRGG
jgi:trans-aconitate methyltransferase